MNRFRTALVALGLVGFAACSGGGGGTGAPGVSASPTATPPTMMTTPTMPPPSTPTPTPSPNSAAPASIDVHLVLPSNFYGNTIAQITSPRQLVALPNGDLLVGSRANNSDGSSTVFLVPNAEAPGATEHPVAFVSVPDTQAQGITYAPAANAIYIATTNAVWMVPYRVGDLVARSAPARIVRVRTGAIAPNSDGDVHSSTSVTASSNALYIGVGSSCNACTEVDPTRAVVLRTDLSGAGMTTVATRLRNAIALAIDPSTGTLWAGGAGQDCLVPAPARTCAAQDDAYKSGHPFEYIDPVTTHGAGPADYGWPDCEENHTAYTAGAICTGTVVPQVIAPAYSTMIGATFYPKAPAGTYAFPAAYGGGLFATLHGSWHESSNGVPIAAPDVIFVPLVGDRPVTPVDWSAPKAGAQWTSFVDGFQNTDGTRYGRPTGIAVGSQGSLFIADDATNTIMRVRPGTDPHLAARRRLP